jgi:hypothetical protein
MNRTSLREVRAEKVNRSLQGDFLRQKRTRRPTAADARRRVFQGKTLGQSLRFTKTLLSPRILVRFTWNLYQNVALAQYYQ